MARKVANGVNKRQKRRSDRDYNRDAGLSSSERNFSTNRLTDRSHLVREWINNPSVKYVAGGIAAAVLTRLAQNMAEKYPELSRFLRENIDSFEGRLGQYRTGFGGGEERESRV